MKSIKVGIRPSKLAEIQAREVIDKFCINRAKIKFEIKKFKTTGDFDKITPLAEIRDEYFFTRQIDEALITGEIDIAIHSAKDLPTKLNPKFEIIFLSKSPNPYDALVSKNNLRLNELPFRAKIGTSSKSRKEQLKKYRDDFVIEDIRGNIEQRVNFLYNSDLDAIVIAAVALERLKMDSLITEIIPENIIKPHPLQGRIAVVARKYNERIKKILRFKI